MAAVGTKKRPDKSKRPLIVRRTSRVESIVPSGTWKITYADFVTALMAFFLLMWLTTTVSTEDLKLIAKYFQTPLTFKYLGAKSRELNSGAVENGGGSDLSRKNGNVQESNTPSEDNRMTADQLLRQKELVQLENLKTRLTRVIDSSPGLSKFKNQLRIELTSEGLRILIFDEQNRPMFEIGKSTPEPYTVDILHAIGGVLNQVPNRISLSGHTDATLYQGGEANYSNWELSADRANASRRELIAGGMAAGKIARVVGLASSVLLDPIDPFSPNNRRISIIVMNQQAEEAALR